MIICAWIVQLTIYLCTLFPKPGGTSQDC